MLLYFGEMMSERTQGAPVDLRKETGGEQIGSRPPASARVEAPGWRHGPASNVHTHCVCVVTVE